MVYMMKLLIIRRPIVTNDLPILDSNFIMNTILRIEVFPRLCGHHDCSALTDCFSQRLDEALQRKREAVEKEKRARAEKREALETFYRELEQLEVAFSPQRWNAIVEKVVVGTDGEMTFHFVNGAEVDV